MYARVNAEHQLTFAGEMPTSAKALENIEGFIDCKAQKSGKAETVVTSAPREGWV